MADITNGVIKFYDENVKKWVMAKTAPIEQLVVKAMKDNWLKNKKQINYWLLEHTENVPEPIRLVVFTDGNEIDDYTKSAFEFAFHDFISTLSNKKNFPLDEFLKNCRNTGVNIPKQFYINVNIEIIDKEYGNSYIEMPSINNITKNVDITSILANEENANMTVRYIYNDNAIEDYKFVKAGE